MLAGVVRREPADHRLLHRRTSNPQTYRGSLGATNYYLKKFGKNALHGAYVYPSDLKSAKNTQVPAFTAQQDAGIKQDSTFDVSGRAPQSDYTPIVQSMKDNGADLRPPRWERRRGHRAAQGGEDPGREHGEGLGLLAAVLRQGHGVVRERGRHRGPVRVAAVPPVRGGEADPDDRELPEVHRQATRPTASRRRRSRRACSLREHRRQRDRGRR